MTPLKSYIYLLDNIIGVANSVYRFTTASLGDTIGASMGLMYGFWRDYTDSKPSFVLYN